MTGFLPPFSSPSVLESSPAGAAPATAAPLSFLRTPSSAASLPLAVAELDSTETFGAISTEAGDLVASGRAAKFLIDRRNPAAPSARFVNGNFVRDGVVPGRGQVPLPLRSGDLPDSRVARDLQRGDVLHARQAVHRRQRAHLPPRRIARAGVRPAVLPPGRDPRAEHGRGGGAVRTQIGIADARFAFVPTGSQQTTATVAADLAALGIEVLPLDRILGAIQYLPLNLGEAWGHLRVFPRDSDELTATDIPVFDELPLDLSVVAGVLTRAVQDTNSHVNLKSKERNTPNAVLRDAGPDHPRLAPFADQPVHLVVGRDDFMLEPTTEEVVAAKLAERMDRPLTSCTWTPETELRSYDEIATGTPRQTRELRGALRVEGRQHRLPRPSRRAGSGRRHRAARARSAATTWFRTASRCRCRPTATSSSIRRTRTSATLIDGVRRRRAGGRAVAEAAGRSASTTSSPGSWPHPSRPAHWNGCAPRSTR